MGVYSVTVDIRFFDIDGREITEIGYDFGITKKNTRYEYPVIIKNLGDTDATGLSVSGSPLNSPVDVPSEEYERQLLASTWQTFSLLPSLGFSSTLELPNIPAGQTMVGLKEFRENFSNPVSSAWVNDTLDGHIFQWTGSSLLCVDGNENDGKIYAKVDSLGWGNNKEIDFTCKFNTPANNVPGSAFIMFCLRRNSIGDQRGYALNLKRTAPSGSGGTGIFEIRKCAGLFDNGRNDFGTILVTSQSFNFEAFCPVRIKLFTNGNGLPEIQAWVNNVLVRWGASNPTDSWVDSANTYPNAGGISIIFGSSIGGTYELREASLITEDYEGKVYIRTSVGDGAIDGVEYNSAMEVYYD
jgi:hypothetical protein